MNMASGARQRLTRALMRSFGPNRSRAWHAAGAAITSLQYALARVATRGAQPGLSAQAAEWLASVRRQGYCVVPGFYDAAMCAACVSELQRLYAEYPAFVQRKSDLRVFGVESASPILHAFSAEPRLLQIAESVLREPSVNAFTLGARLDYSSGNLGSGEGWHRDSFVVQFKAILYLSDVEIDNGPFELIADSERLAQLAADMLQARLGLAQNRIDDAQVASLLARHPERLCTFVAPAGTLLLVNTSAIHRGRPIERGVRYALTNYYVQRRRAGAAMDAHFAPVLRAGRCPVAAHGAGAAPASA